MVHSPPLTTDIAHRVEFCGGIGAGKSEVAKLLATRLGCPLIAESYRSVPFWRLHQKHVGFEFPKNIGFLITHLEKLFEEIGEAACKLMICDFSFDQMLAYSEAAGSPDEQTAFREVHELLLGRIGRPIATVHLTCSLQLQSNRIRRRARPGEVIPKSTSLSSLNEQISADLSERDTREEIMQFSNNSDAAGSLDALASRIADRIKPLLRQANTGCPMSLR